MTTMEWAPLRAAVSARSPKDTSNGAFVGKMAELSYDSGLSPRSPMNGTPTSSR